MYKQRQKEQKVSVSKAGIDINSQMINLAIVFFQKLFPPREGIFSHNTKIQYKCQAKIPHHYKCRGLHSMVHSNCNVPGYAAVFWLNSSTPKFKK